MQTIVLVDSTVLSKSIGINSSSNICHALCRISDMLIYILVVLNVLFYGSLFWGYRTCPLAGTYGILSSQALVWSICEYMNTMSSTTPYKIQSILLEEVQKWTLFFEILVYLLFILDHSCDWDFFILSLLITQNGGWGGGGCMGGFVFLYPEKVDMSFEAWRHFWWICGF